MMLKIFHNIAVFTDYINEALVSARKSYQTQTCEQCMFGFVWKCLVFFTEKKPLKYKKTNK